MLEKNGKKEIHQRAQMLKRFLEMELSDSTESMIADTFDSLPGETEILEAHARKINRILDSCQNEEEVIQKIKAFTQDI